ncbi:probable ATP-dependent RNA helicase DDX60 [Hyperolius riggenbachi]|uniref:probable ATP-dependent RNA helicase DDX60 n=1 Tax=Hyperolius riggenbachi TaxID=752182 RepID=UPI0035A355B1
MASEKLKKNRKRNNKTAASSTENQTSETELAEHAAFLDSVTAYLLEQLSRATTFESLLNNFVESESFLIDGDSLLIMCATNDSLKQGQNLHFMYLVEHFLLNLKYKGANYNIVFFKDMEHFYTGRSDLVSLRTQLMLHLENNTDITVHTFSNFLCEEWKEFVTDHVPYFMMVSDEGLDNSQTYALHMLILNALGNQINVVLTAGQESDYLRVFGYHINANSHQRMYLQKNGKQIKKAFTKLITSLQAAEKQDSSTFMQHMKNMTKQVLSEMSLLTDGSDARIFICTISCSMALRICAERDGTLQDDETFLEAEEVADLCKMMCLSQAVMIVVPLSQRAKFRIINAKWNTAASRFINLQKRCEAFTLSLLRDHSKALNGPVNWNHISDLSDDLLLKNIAYCYEKEEFSDGNLDYGKDVYQVFQHIWDRTLQLSCIKQLQSCQLRTTSTPLLSEKTIIVHRGKKESLGLIPMRSKILDDYAGGIINDLAVLKSNDLLVTFLAQAKPFDELTHWHSRKPLSDDYDRTKHVPIKDDYALRSYQKFQTFQRFYGKSLGMCIAKQIVLKSNEACSSHKEPKASGKKKETQMKKKDQIIQENLKKIRMEEEKKEIEKWRIKASILAKEFERDVFHGIRQAEQFFNSVQTKSIKFKAQFQALETCFSVWASHCKATATKGARDMRVVVEIMKLLQTIVNDHQDVSQINKLIPFLNSLGFENLTHSMQQLKATSSANKDSKYAVGNGSSRFQMQHMGPYLKKDDRTDPDPRVQHFIPDTWQRELLDVVDNNESAVIVAPTSSGKTYASYYCMEKVLTESHDGVVVYVAPTKALVNQVVAMVINQFTKDLPKGMAICGVFTRDYRCDALNCQVLVTVPQCLEILLLSPHHQIWVKRIKYMIFDEVHCLGGEIGAEVWEHLLAMIRCPFLALSATISNPEHLTEWLQCTRKYWKLHDEAEEKTVSQKRTKKSTPTEGTKSYRVRLVLHDKRYNDLEKYVCTAEKDKIAFHHYHPCAALTIEQIQEHGIPKDLSFSPRETLQLYDAMVNEWPEWPRKTRIHFLIICISLEKELDPENNVHLKDKMCITKCDAANYEKEVKNELTEWVGKGLKHEASRVLKSFKCPPSHKPLDCEKLFPQLVEQLRILNKLPALFFTFNIKLVESLAKNLGKSMNKNWERSQTKQIVKEMQKLQIKEKRLEKTAKPSRKDESFVKEANVQSLKHRLENMYAVPPEYTYACNGAVDKETLLEMFERIKHVRHSEEFISLAERGIGFHHGSMDYKGRRFVEMLFRMGHLQVVTATSSLALGINMPCKSVVFLNNSSYLDSLNYRQMAGRAGRRGLDLEGNVYFFNIPSSKVKDLVKSNVPELKGQFPLSITFVLRLMLLAARADDKQDAKAKVLSVLKHSLMTFKHHFEAQMLKMYFVFSLQFLVYEGYLDQECNPLELTGMVTHLHYHEPSNFVFVRFLKKGLFHKLCKPSIKYPGTFPDSVMETLMLVLANLFGREYILSQRAGPFYQSKVQLEKLPDDFAAVVEEYNRSVAVIFGQCILTASKLANMEEEYKLPLSKINFSGKECLDSALVDHLLSSSEGRSGISPFACLSGNTDHDDLTMKNITLQKIHIPQKYFPKFHLEKVDACGRTLHLNSYALDFFKHGSIKAIVTDNGFNEGDAYYKLKDFYLTISAISVSITEMCENDLDPVAMAFGQLKEKFSRKLQLVNYTKVFV